MPHDTALVTTIAAGLGLAFVLGLIAAKVGVPPLVGYLIAGIVVGPFTPGLVADTGLAQQLAEIGVILLMFGVGIHFSVDDLLAVKRIALPGAAVQIVIATALGVALAYVWGWSWGSGIVLGLCLSVASTVVLLRTLEDRGLLDSVDGQIAVGWLIVQDIVTVLVLVLLPVVASTLGSTAPRAIEAASAGLVTTLLITFGKLGLFVALIFVVGRRAVPWLLERVAHTGSRELFTLGVLAVALGIAVGAAALFGVSVALGAFFAGMVVGGSDISHEAAADSLPLQDAFAVLFFVAVGMLFDPMILVEQPLRILAVLLIVMVGKSAGAFAIALLLRYPLHTALTTSVGLAQIGEFSFILAALGLTLGILPAEGQGLIVAVSILSISLNPLMFASARWFNRWATARPGLLARLERKVEVVADLPEEDELHPLRNHVIMVGHGRVGRIVAAALDEGKTRYVVVDEDLATIESLRKRGITAFFGDASRGGVLDQANLADARMLIVTAPDPYKTRAIIGVARQVNPDIDTVVRTHSERERRYLERINVGLAVMGEQELANTMARHAMKTLVEPA